MSIETKFKKVVVSGKRKRAIARAVVTNGTGKVIVNQLNYESLPFFAKLTISEPIRIAEQVLGKLTFDAIVTVRGGGEKGQTEAVRLAIAKGYVKFTASEELKKTFLQYDRNLLVADIRRKETRKPGDSKARAKRQTSYR